MSALESLEQLRATFLFPTLALVVVGVAFVVGYRSPKSLPAAVDRAPRASNLQTSASESIKAVVKSGPNDHARVRVEGFAKIGFAETKELISTASLEQREQWAQELGALPDRPLKKIALTALYSAWLDLEPESALRSLRHFPDLLSRQDVFFTVGAAAPPAILPQFVEVVAGLSESERRRLLPPFLKELDGTDPAAAARFIESRPEMVSNSDAAQLMSAWAGDDPLAAQRWLEASAFADAPLVLDSFVKTWLTKDPAAARDYVLLHRESAGIYDAASSVASHLLSASRDQARAFITSFDQEVGSSLLSNAISKVDPSQLPLMADWISTFPGALRDQAMGVTLSRWNDSDPSGAASWLRVKPPSEREPLLLSAIDAQYNPASLELVSLAFGIQNAELREEALSKVARTFNDDQGKWVDQIQALGLPPSQTKHLVELHRLQSDVPSPDDH
ncbi:MAG: hypothetical protein ABI992_10120 [Chthoniobacterales bacterium]